ncbi:MAG TPA: hypothetical protein VJH04_03115 [archaeon]|nr:hypothetical protein [archaeon]
MSKVSEWVNRNKKALGYAVGGTAAAVATHFGLDTRAFHGQSIYDMTDSTARFTPYLFTALSYGRALEITAEGKKGRALTTGERMFNYGIGALVASGLWEGVENLSSIDSAYRVMHGVADSLGHGDYIKSEFPGKGMASIGDAAITLAATELFAAAKKDPDI